MFSFTCFISNDNCIFLFKKKFFLDLKTLNAFPLHVMALFGLVWLILGAFILRFINLVLFTTSLAEVPSEPYPYQNMVFTLC